MDNFKKVVDNLLKSKLSTKDMNTFDIFLDDECISDALPNNIKILKVVVDVTKDRLHSEIKRVRSRR